MAEVLEAPAEVKVEAPVVEVPKGDAPVVPVEPAKTYTQEELDRITAKVKKNAAYRARRETEARLQGLQEGMRLVKPAEPVKPVDDTPVRDQFGSYEEFVEAKAAYAGRKAAREQREADDKETKVRTAAETRAKSLESFQGKIRTKFPDFEERFDHIGDITLPSGVDEAIWESELGPEILDHFATNPKDCERIASLAPSAAIREIGKLEARLELATKPSETPAAKPPVKPASKAPEPIKPGGSAAGPTDETPKDSDDINEWMRKERARERKLRA